MKRRKKTRPEKASFKADGDKTPSKQDRAGPLRERFFARPVHLLAAVIAGYLILTLIFGFLGYLKRPDNRIKPVDSVYYFAYLRSGLMDGDLDFHNELERFYPKGNNSLTPRGLPTNPFSIGPAIFWAPFFVLAHGLTLLFQMLGATVKADGYSGLYQLFVYIGNSLYGVAGLCLTALILRMYVSRMAALLACLGVLFVSQMTYYFWSFTATSHNVSFFSTALYLYLFLKYGPTRWTAVAAALMVLARWQNAIFLIPVVFHFIRYFPKRGDLEGIDRKSYLKKYAVSVGMLCLAILPQPLVWWVLYGAPFLIPQGPGFVDLTQLHVVSALFSLRHGLFTWHPLLLIGLAGLLLLWKRDRLLCLSLLAVIVLQTLLNASIEDWWAGWSFGNRRFISLLPLFALGTGLVLDKLKRGGLIAGALLILMLGIWNQLFIYQYMHGLIPRGKTISFQQLVTDKFRLPALIKIKAENEKAMQLLNQRRKSDLSTFKIHAAKTFSFEPRLWVGVPSDKRFGGRHSRFS
ncbi:MAG: hypothetical protein JRK53_11505 [Deltaproteobacteria bacterium]|nr:hypothetical protein [Deltaproteobacteria bacterium]